MIGWDKKGLGVLLIRNVLSLLAVLPILLGAPVAQASSFTPVGATNGLEARVVPAILLDRDGFLWVGSREGLFRYDGYRAEAFLPQRGNPGAISDVDIRCVYQGADGAVWVGTNTGGLDRHDPVTGKFRNFRSDPDDPATLIDDSINAISEGSDGSLWVATQAGLARLDPASGKFEHFRHDPKVSGSLSAGQATALHLGASGRLWIGTVGGGVNRWNPDTHDFSGYDLAALTAGPARRNHVLALQEDETGVVWAGTREGLVRLDPEKGHAEYVDLGVQEGYSPIVTALQMDGSQQLWLTTMGRGLLILNRESGEWRQVNAVSSDKPDNLPPDALMSLAIGPDQAFIGTWGDGVYRTPLHEEAFELFNMNNTEGLTNNVISAVMATDETGQPWLGSYGGGPQRMNIAERLVQAKPLSRHQMRESGVMGLAGPIDGRLYAATTRGLYEFTADGIQVALFEYDPESAHSIGPGDVTVLLPAGDAGLWIGMGGSGLLFFNTRAQSFTSFRHEPNVPDSISGDYVTALLAGGKGYLWVGTRAHGLNRCRIDEWSCERFAVGSSGQNSFGQQSVAALFRDRRGQVWVGTDGGGLYKVNQGQDGKIDEFTHWGSEDGLLNDGIMAIQQDLDESLWLSTRYGLSRLDPAAGAVINFVPAAGLPVSHFNTGSSSADERYLYFGSTGGLLVIPKGSSLRERLPPKVRITGVRQAEPGGPWKDLERSEAVVRLPYKHVLAVELAVLDYAESSNEYAYRLDSSDPWSGLGLQRQIIFQGLAPGRYDFQARGRDAYGSWGLTRVLALEVVPPFWMTLWFRGLMAVAVAFLILSIHFARQAKMKRRSAELLRLSEKREHALEVQLGSAAELAVLTPRQKEILQLLAEGYSTRETAELLGVSVKTVETHRANLMERLDIRDLPGLVRLAIRTRLISVDG